MSREPTRKLFGYLIDMCARRIEDAKITERNYWRKAGRYIGFNFLMRRNQYNRKLINYMGDVDLRVQNAATHGKRICDGQATAYVTSKQKRDPTVFPRIWVLNVCQVARVLPNIAA